MKIAIITLAAVVALGIGYIAGSEELVEVQVTTKEAGQFTPACYTINLVGKETGKVYKIGKKEVCHKIHSSFG